MDNIIKKLKAVIKEEYNIEIEDDEELGKRGIDSLETVKLIVLIEQYFDISFPAENMNSIDLKNIKNIAKCIYGIINK